jgi:transposase InsO family protein
MMRFNPVVKHVPGKELVIADALSRKPLPLTLPDVQKAEEVEEFVDYVQASWPASDKRLTEIQVETASDPALQMVTRAILQGWPSNTVPEMMKPYLQAKGELSIVDGILTMGDRIVVPPSLRREMLSRLHESHQGLEKCRANAKAAVWWPGIGQDIQNMIESCLFCCENRSAQRCEPLKPTQLPTRPWEKIAVDLCEHKKRHFLVAIDFYSRWIEVKQLFSTSASAVIGRLKDMFATHGIPDELMSDNGPQFTAEEFREFATQYGFARVTSSPHHHQGNGEAERAVQTVKKMLDQKDVDLALLNYRNSPHSATKVSPAMALMGRRMKTRMPTLTKQLMPALPDHEAMCQADKSAKQRLKADFDRRHGARLLKPLPPGQSVLIRLDTDKDWCKTGTVIQADPENRTYLVQTQTGTVRRNRRHLQDLPALPPLQESPVDLDLPEEQLEPALQSPSSEGSLSTPPCITPDSPQARRPVRMSHRPQRLIEQC